MYTSFAPFEFVWRGQFPTYRCEFLRGNGRRIRSMPRAFPFHCTLKIVWKFWERDRRPVGGVAPLRLNRPRRSASGA